MEDLSKLAEQMDAEIKAAQKLHSALESSIAFALDMEALGYRVKSAFDDGCLTLWFEVEEPEPARPTKQRIEHSAPKPITLDVSDAPCPTPEPVKEKSDYTAPAIVTGPFSDAENETVIDMAARGHEAHEIATALNRTARHIGNKIRNYLADDIAKRKAEIENLSEPVEPPKTPTFNYANKFNLSGAEKRIDYHLEFIGYPGHWTSRRDLDLVTALVRGDGIANAADQIGLSGDAVKKRWDELNSNPGDIDHQTRLIKVLKMRAGELSVAAE